MAINTIEYTVDIAGVVPATEQFGGTQGDHRVTQLNYELKSELFDSILSAAGSGRVMCRFDVHDGEGGIWQSEPKPLGENVQLVLEERHTHFGGKITVYLVITVLSEDNETEMELYSFPSVLRLKNRPEGTYQDGEDHKSVTGLVEIAKANAKDAASYSVLARAAELSARQLAAEVEQKLANGEFDGKDGVSVTHSFDGTVLKMTSASGTTSVDLQGEKGDQGPKGDKGDKGSDGEITNLDQTYSPTSENAQSGKAVAEAVKKAKNECVPIPAYEGASGIEKVMVYDDAHYFEDENYNRYYTPSSFKPRRIDDAQDDYTASGIIKGKERTAECAGYIAARDSKGNLWTGLPVDDADCANKKYVEGVFFELYRSVLKYVVSLPPLPNIGDENTLYFVPSTLTEDQYYLCDEYIYVSGSWLKIGSASAEVDLTDYVKKTDYATSSTGGVVKSNSDGGFIVDGGLGYIASATISEIISKVNRFKPIVPETLDLAVKVGLTANTETLTDEEKAAAQSWLGVDALVGDIETALDELHNYAQALINGGAE